METLSITFYNASSRDGAFMCFRTTSGVSLAWWAKQTHPRTRVRFDWITQYDLFWAEGASLAPGTLVWANETLPVDPLGKTGPNAVTFDKVDGAFEFRDPIVSDRLGTLAIASSGVIPLGAAALAIGMSGLPYRAVPAVPDQTVVFSPNSDYWIAFGPYATGEVLEPHQITTAAKLAFPTNVSAMTAIYGENCAWSIAPTDDLRAALSADLLCEVDDIDRSVAEAEV